MRSLDCQMQLDQNRNYALQESNSEQDPVEKQKSAAAADIKKYWPTLSDAAATSAADFKKVLELASKETQQDQTEIFTRVGKSEEALIHKAARHGNAEIVKLIVEKVPHLLTRKGINGDTVWHIAAKTGNLFDELYKLRNEFKNSIGKNSVKVTSDDLSLMDVNEEGNTALQEALIYRHKSMAHDLVKYDSDLLFYVNKGKKSALYLAAEAGYEDTVKYMLEVATNASNKRQEHGKLKLGGKSIVHAAIMGGNIAVLTHILEGEAMLIERIHVEGREIDRRLTETKDEEGMNPLHWAASVGFLEGVSYLIDKKIPMFKDKKKLYPIHWASMNGHVEVVKALLPHHDNLKNLVTSDDHNVLHLAAKHGRHNVVRYILDTDKTPELAYLLNKGDAQKNTPLHLAAIHWHPKVVSALTWDNRVDLNSVDEEGFTALDAVVLNMKGIGSFRQWQTWQILKASGASRVTSSKDLNTKRTASMIAKPTNNTNYKITLKVLLLVSIIVGMVSFDTGSTNLAYDNSVGTFLGITAKIKNQSFDFCNMVSLYTSIAVTIVLIQAHFGDANRAFSALRFAKPLLGMALTMTCLALLSGVYLVLGKVHWFVDIILTTGLVLLVLFSTLLFPLCFPLPSGYRISRYITYYPIRLMIFLTKQFKDDHLEE